MKQIAIIGTEGSGKTVFLTILAKRFANNEPGRVFIDPRGVTTVRFVETNWNLLTEGRWPDTTLAGQSFSLKWRCHTPDGNAFDLRAMDCAGQDLRRLFDDNPPDELRPLAEYFTSSQIILFLVNPANFVGVADRDRAIDNEAAIKEAMDRLRDKDRFCGLVLTQADLHPNLLLEEGDLRNASKALVPIVHNAHLVTYADDVGLFAVAAVKDTEIRVNEKGESERVPKRDFQSVGLDEVMDWIVKSAAKIKTPVPPPPEPPPKSEPPKSEPPVSQRPPEQPTSDPFSEWFGLALIVAAILVLGFFFLKGCAPDMVTCDNCKGSGKVFSVWHLIDGSECPKCLGEKRIPK